MSFPVYLPGGIHPHFVFEAAAYALAFIVYLRLRRRFGDTIGINDRWSVIAAAAVGAALGSKLLSIFEDPHHLAFGGKTIIGGLLGGLIAVELTKLAVGVRRPTGDLFAVPIAIGIAIGRIGCFLTGLADNTYGMPSTLPWAVDFGDGIRRHPVQLYESLFALLLALALWRVLHRPHREGDVFKLFMVAYLLWRLAIDFLKPRAPIAGLSTLQWACALCLFYYCPDISRWIWPRPRRETIAQGAP